MNMKTLADACGVSTATVSYALRGDPRISEATRQRVLKKAEELKYYPDSFGSALVQYKNKHVFEKHEQRIGIIYAHPRTSRRTSLIQPHLQSFRNTITPYGYGIKEFFLGNEPNSPEVLASQLNDLGIRGLVLAWGLWENRLNGFPWERFSVVSAERNEIHPALDRVSFNHFNATDIVYQALQKRNCRRIGLICHDDLLLRARKSILGAYMMNIRRDDNNEDNIPPFFYNIGESPDRFRHWYDSNGLDGIISHRIIDPFFFKQAALSIPQDAQLAVIEIEEAQAGEESGIVVNQDLGRILTETITGKLHYNDRVDLNHEGTLIMVDGHWHEGRTTHPIQTL